MHVTKSTPDRLHLDLRDDLAVRAFMKNCNVTLDDVVKAERKVGNSLAALRKELCGADDKAKA